MVKPRYNFSYVIYNQNHMCPQHFWSAPTCVLKQPSQNALKELHDIATDGYKYNLTGWSISGSEVLKKEPYFNVRKILSHCCTDTKRIIEGDKRRSVTGGKSTSPPSLSLSPSSPHPPFHLE